MTEIASKYSNTTLRVVLTASYEHIINILVDYVMGINFGREKISESAKIVREMLSVARFTTYQYAQRFPYVYQECANINETVHEYLQELKGRPHTDILLKLIYSTKNVPQHTQTYLYA